MVVVALPRVRPGLVLGLVGFCALRQLRVLYVLFRNWDKRFRNGFGVLCDWMLFHVVPMEVSCCSQC